MAGQKTKSKNRKHRHAGAAADRKTELRRLRDLIDAGRAVQSSTERLMQLMPATSFLVGYQVKRQLDGLLMQWQSKMDQLAEQSSDENGQSVE